MELIGLTEAEVKKRRSLGLSNTVIDSYSPSYLKIVLRHVFSLINIVIVPLLIALAFFEQYREIFAFITFLIVNTLISILDEVRVKRTLDKLKTQFQITTKVVRDSKEIVIPVSQVVKDDIVLVGEGESIIADGQIIFENYLQVDESMLTGESNYIRKQTGEKVLSASYVVTGNCYYKVENVGKGNYLNKLGSEAVKYKEKKSLLQQNADKLITFLVIASLIFGALTYFSSQMLGTSTERSLLALTTVISLIIPQTLIFLFTLAFTISTVTLYRKGVLVQKAGSIEDLANIDVICLDKTGTITTNEMDIKEIKYFNLDESFIGGFYNSIASKLVGVNKTQEVINKYFAKFPIGSFSDFDQVPFTSKQKYSQVYAKYNEKFISLTLGAFSVLEKNLSREIAEEVSRFLSAQEEKGFRTIVGLVKESSDAFQLSLDFESSKVAIFVIEEKLNAGIEKLLKSFEEQKIEVKIISGDSKISVERIIQKLGITNKGIADLSEEGEIEDLETVVTSHSIFTRAKPEDKLKIIASLQNKGFNVAMVGDGINDVLALKAANVSIAMEAGTKIARDVSDMVLLNNDYNKIPEIFFEGDNIVFNLKISTKMFLTKSFFSILLTIFFILFRRDLALLPASTLIFSFLGSSTPSYIVIFTRQKVKNIGGFFGDVLRSAIPASLAYIIPAGLFYALLSARGYSDTELNTALVTFILSVSVIYSLYLIYESGKVKNILYLFFFYIIVMMIGIYETILPLDRNEGSTLNLQLYGLTYIGIFLLVLVIRNLFKIYKLRFLLVIGLVAAAVITVAMFFPFRAYYNVTRIPVEMYYYVFGMSAVSFILIIVLTKIVEIYRRWTTRKNQLT